MADDFERAAANLLKIGDAVREALPEAVAAGARPIAEEARRRAPRDRGDLVESIDDKPVAAKGNSATHAVVAGEFYSAFHEYGTSKMRAQPFMRPAADTKKGEARVEIEGVVNEAISKAVGS